MKERQIVLKNFGMNRDTSISKTDGSAAYENINIRIDARENSTQFTVTNERGNKQIDFGEPGPVGTLIGWNVLGSHIILFTHDTAAGVASPDHIYRVDYQPGEQYEFAIQRLFTGNLDFDLEHPIESVVYYETEEIQKIYWVDGKHVLRFMNFMADSTERQRWTDGTAFDSNKAASFNVDVTIDKDNSGNARPNGVIQYLLTYFNKYGQETGYVWVSDLVYLSPTDKGGTVDGQNNNKVTLRLSGLDGSRFTHYRVYSVFRSSLNGQTTAYLVQEAEIPSNNVAIVIDDGAHLVAEDSSRLLYLGSRPVVFGTLTHKDNTLFLGDIDLSGEQDKKTHEAAIQEAVNQYLFKNGVFVEGSSWESGCITFTATIMSTGTIPDITIGVDGGGYSYKSQLSDTSSQITTFKGGEKYRFALVFGYKDGSKTRAFWIGDKVNNIYPEMTSSGTAHRAVVRCTLPAQFVQAIKAISDLATVQLHIAEATYADRAVKAQGILNPTMFNVWDRYNRRAYAVPSWITRPRGSGFAFKHFEPVHNSNSSTGEIACNYWAGDTPYPFYQLKNYDTKPELLVKPEGSLDYDYLMLLYRIHDSNVHTMGMTVVVIKAKWVGTGSDHSSLTGLHFDNELVHRLGPPDYTIQPGDAWSNSSDYSLMMQSMEFFAIGNGNKPATMEDLYTRVINWLKNTVLITDPKLLPTPEAFINSWGPYAHSREGRNIYFNSRFGLADNGFYGLNQYTDIANYIPDGAQAADRWYRVSEISYTTADAFTPAYAEQHLMFVDENVVTLNSPEIDNYAALLDNVSGYKLRVVGVAKIDRTTGDYTVDASHGKLPGTNLIDTGFVSNPDGLSAWPLWSEYGLDVKTLDESGNAYTTPSLIADRDSSDYNWAASLVNYWLYMWGSSGKINKYSDKDNSDYSTLHKKTFANYRYSPVTYYVGSKPSYTPDSLRLFTDVTTGYTAINVGNSEVAERERLYEGAVSNSLSMPGSRKYPVYYSLDNPVPGEIATANSALLYTNYPVQLSYLSSPHMVISLPTRIENGIYKQTTLPTVFSSEKLTIPERDPDTKVTGALLPWLNKGKSYPNYVALDHWEDGTYVPDVQLDIVNDVTGSYSVLISTMDTIDDSHPAAYQYWAAAKKIFGDGPVYCKVRVDNFRETRPAFRYYNAIVDVSSYVLDHTARSATISNPDILAMAYDSDTDSTIEVNLATLTYHATAPNWREGTPFRASAAIISNSYEVNDDDQYVEYQQVVSSLSGLNGKISSSDRYVLMGELYREFDTASDYGGLSHSAILNNRFIPAGPSYRISNLDSQHGGDIYANRGDTYFQRWDCLKTKPGVEGSVDNVIDVTSVMVETHINLDGRSDNYRGTRYLASINTEEFGKINPVYSQMDNYLVKRAFDEDTDTALYSSALTWTLPKEDSALVDEWTHITLASVLKLDGDKGKCNALHRFQDRILAFQDKGISEILFNSRTQLSTNNGVPVEIANTGKVDGKHYLTNKFGCSNKWSIIEGKKALYFVDSINKAFCSIGDGIDNISSRLNFAAYFRRKNTLSPWTPENRTNFLSFYDRIHSDVYLFSGDGELPCLVYNETLGCFTSFYSYADVSMMANVGDRFLAFRNFGSSLWLQNEGEYNKFFGTYAPFSMKYRVTPDPYGDKIWTNVEYQADFMDVSDADSEEPTLDDNYLENETFDSIEIDNEYQHASVDTKTLTKRFRTWRFVVPRADITATNKYGLDRIRNPWITITFGRDNTQDDMLMQMHDITVKYFE